MPTVIVAVDQDDDRARRQAATLRSLEFDPAATRIRLVHVFQDNPEGATIAQVGAVRRARELLEDAGFDVTLEGRSGEPADEIVAAADEHDADLICVAGRKRTPAGKALFGSVTQDVFLTTDRPVLLSSRPAED